MCAIRSVHGDRPLWASFVAVDRRDLLVRFNQLLAEEDIGVAGKEKSEGEQPVRILSVLAPSRLRLLALRRRDAALNLEGHAVGAGNAETGSIASNLRRDQHG